MKHNAMVLVTILTLVPALAPLAHANMLYGLKGGISVSRVNADLFETDNRTGFVGGAYMAFDLTPNIAFQPELLYVRKGAKLFSTNITIGGITFGSVGSTLDVDYLEVPLLLRFSAPTASSVDLRLLAGPVVALKVNEQLTTTGLIGYSLDSDQAKSSDFGVAVGAAVAGTTGTMNLVAEGRYTFGMTDISDLPFGGDVKNAAFYVMAGVEFPFGVK